jgi:hypothetical protein
LGDKINCGIDFSYFFSLRPLRFFFLRPLRLKPLRPLRDKNLRASIRGASPPRWNITPFQGFKDKAFA